MPADREGELPGPPLLKAWDVLYSLHKTGLTHFLSQRRGAPRSFRLHSASSDHCRPRHLVQLLRNRQQPEGLVGSPCRWTSVDSEPVAGHTRRVPVACGRPSEVGDDNIICNLPLPLKASQMGLEDTSGSLPPCRLHYLQKHTVLQRLRSHPHTATPCSDNPLVDHQMRFEESLSLSQVQTTTGPAPAPRNEVAAGGSEAAKPRRLSQPFMAESVVGGRSVRA